MHTQDGHSRARKRRCKKRSFMSAHACAYVCVCIYESHITMRGGGVALPRTKSVCLGHLQWASLNKCTCEYTESAVSISLVSDSPSLAVSSIPAVLSSAPPTFQVAHGAALAVIIRRLHRSSPIIIPNLCVVVRRPGCGFPRLGFRRLSGSYPVRHSFPTVSI